MFTPFSLYSTLVTRGAARPEVARPSSRCAEMAVPDALPRSPQHTLSVLTSPLENR